MLVVYFGPLQRVFQTEALPAYDLVVILLVASSMVLLDTTRKVLFPDGGPEASVSQVSLSASQRSSWSPRPVLFAMLHMTDSIRTWKRKDVHGSKICGRCMYHRPPCRGCDWVVLSCVALSYMPLSLIRPVNDCLLRSQAWLGSSLMKGMKHGMGRNKLSMA